MILIIQLPAEKCSRQHTAALVTINVLEHDANVNYARRVSRYS